MTAPLATLTLDELIHYHKDNNVVVLPSKYPLEASHSLWDAKISPEPIHVSF